MRLAVFGATGPTGQEIVRESRRRGHEPHTLTNHSAFEARYLLICAPAGFDRYFDRIAADQAGNKPPADAATPLPETITLAPPLDPIDADDGAA